jgi:ribonuclease J
MGQRKLSEVKADDVSKRPNVRKKTGNTVLDATHTRKGEVLRAARRINDNVNAQASQHTIDHVPVNRSTYNGYEGLQYTPAEGKKRQTIAKRRAAKTPSLKVIPIGGVAEMGIGKNMTALEYGDEIIIIDMGFLFPGDDYPGINYIVPDVTYLEERKEKIKAVIFTHGHLDHIGSFHHLIPRLSAPVYATKFTIGMLQKNMEEEDTDYEPDYHELNPENHDRVQLSENFSVELVRVNHSIPDAAAVVIRTPLGVIVSSGDWRFENDPVDGKKFDMNRMTEIAAKEGILLFMNESTNCEDQGSITDFGENDIKVTFGQVMDKYVNSRVIISCFSSQIHRMQNIIDQAAAHGRKVAFAGFSMIQNVEIGLKTGQLRIPEGLVMKMEDLVKLPDEKICIVCTGSQGEFNAVLNRMASGAHRWVKIKDSDVIVFSSNPIPGNENHVTHTVDGLMREGSDVLQNRRVAHFGFGPLHLSGHGKREDHIKLINALNPTYYLPNHGEFHMLVHNAEIAEFECGIPHNNIFVCDAGDVVEFFPDGSAMKTGRVQAGGVMYDDNGSEVSEVVLKDRIHMSTEGIFVVVLTVQKGTGRLLSSPDIISRGFIYLRDSEQLINSIRAYIKQKTARVYAARRVDLDQFKKDLREEIAQILYDQTNRNPIVIPVVNEIYAGNLNEVKKAEAKHQRDEADFARQEMQRIRGGGSAHFAPRRANPQRQNFGKAKSFHAGHESMAREHSLQYPVAGRDLGGADNSEGIDTTRSAAKPASKQPISFKRHQGPSPMKMWKD